MRQQIARLDPAVRSLRLRGFKDENMSERQKIIDKLMADFGINQFSVDPIYKGPAGQRNLTDMCVVAVNSNNVRENFLKEYEKKSGQNNNSGYTDLKVDRAKSAAQLSRNNALRKASDILKKEAPSNSEVKNGWKKTGSKDREVEVNGNPVFRQTISDSSGIFLAPFAHLQV